MFNNLYYKDSEREPDNVSQFIFIGLLVIAFCLFVIPILLFYCGMSLNKYIFPVSVVIGIIVPFRVCGGTFKPKWIVRILYLLLLIILIIIVAGYVYDVSYDGMVYHQETVASFVNGWNPFAKESFVFAPKSIWCIHYCKAIELMAASIAAFTGQIEMGKAVNFMLLLGTAFGVYSLLRGRIYKLFLKNNEKVRSKESWSRAKSIWFTLCIVGNPVVGSQLFTYYIDFYKYLFLLNILIGICWISVPGRNNHIIGTVVLCGTLILSMGSKFNFFFEAGLCMILSMLWCVIKKNYITLRLLAIVSILSLILGMVFCYDPYITNWINNGHPLYPLMGEGAVDIMTGNTPEIYYEHNRVINFIISLFSYSKPSVDQRLGGFTVLMPAIFFIGIYIGLKMTKKIRDVIWYTIICGFLSCFIFAQSWWARYICQLWLVVALLLLVSQFGGKALRKLGYFMSVLMIIAGIWAFSRTLYIGVLEGYYIKSLLETAKTDKVVVSGICTPQTLKHLDEYGIKYSIVDSIPAEKRENVMYYYYKMEPLILLSDNQMEILSDKMKKIGKNSETYRYHED